MNASPAAYLVSGDDLFRSVTRRAFHSAGLRFHGFSDEVEFLDVLSCDGEACIILDLRIPGPRVLELLKERRIDFPVIAYTGNVNVPAAVQAMHWGAYTVMQKPFSRELLIRRVRDAIDSFRDR